MLCVQHRKVPKCRKQGYKPKVGGRRTGIGFGFSLEAQGKYLESKS